jgi:hypothetical protein
MWEGGGEENINALIEHIFKYVIKVKTKNIL